MAVDRRYYSTKEVQAILCVSRTTANKIMHIFEHQGKLFRFGNTIRVEADVFDQWCREQTGRKGGTHT